MHSRRHPDTTLILKFGPARGKGRPKKNAPLPRVKDERLEVGQFSYMEVLDKCVRREGSASRSELVRRILTEWLEDHHQDLMYAAEGLLEPQEDDGDAA